MMKPIILILNQNSLSLAEKIAAIVDGEIAGLESRVTEVATSFSDVKQFVQKAFGEGRPIIGVMACGALIRLLAPVLGDKMIEPPVLSVSEDGASIVPLLGGHHGANDLAREIAHGLEGHAAITTAGDLRFGVALDQPPAGYVLANPENAKGVMAELVAGSSARLESKQKGQAEWLLSSLIPFADDGKVQLVVSDNQQEIDGALKQELTLVYVPKTLVLGMGCERGCDRDAALEIANEAVANSGKSPLAIAAIASIDLKADETAIHSVAQYFGVEARFFSAQELEAESARLQNPSDVVFAEVGCHGVAEGAALASVGDAGELIVAKIKNKKATAALATCEQIVDAEHTGRKRGKLFVVGIGPGQEGWRSPEVSRMIGASTDLVGYSLYLDLIAEISAGKIRHDFDLGKEEDRVRHAMELAGTGRDVALVCSGDAGIYAMATLVFELLDHGGLSDGARRIEIAVSPGISALQAAASRAGAPLGHDFCTISLSDLLTPWEAIQMRVKAAAEGDFVIAFYNPVSKRRRTQLAYARDKLLEHRPADTPVILATNLGRPEEKVRFVPLAELQVDDVDMLTVVVVGSSESRVTKTGDGRGWVYTPRGYSSKVESRMG